MIFDRFDTAVVPFPFSEIPALKRRPVVILSSRRFNAESGSTLCGVITTSRMLTWPTDVVLQDLAMAGLKVDCRIRMRLATIPNTLFEYGLGRLAAIDALACEAAFAQMVRG